MRSIQYGLTLLAIASGASPLFHQNESSATKVIRVVDTVYIAAVSKPIDYDELASQVAKRIARKANTKPADPTIIEGDLIVKGRLGVRGAPEPDTDYPVTVHGPNSAEIFFVSNEALLDPQRKDNQHRHVGSFGVAQDGGVRFNQNGVCYQTSRGCIIEDRQRRLAAAGYDSMGDMSFYLSDVDSTTGKVTAPAAQSLVLRLLDWDHNIHIVAFRPGQKILFNGSTTLNAADLVWEVPLRGSP